MGIRAIMTPKTAFRFAMNKIETSNRVLGSFASSAFIEHRTGVGGGYYIHWPTVHGDVCKRWMTRGGQDFYPVWSHKWIGGGTSCIALSQLVRWCRGEPVLPLSTWRHWASDRVKLLAPDAVDILANGDYPKVTPCVLCGGEITAMDWWSLNGLSGPCCSWTTGCLQRNGSQRTAAR